MLPKPEMARHAKGTQVKTNIASKNVDSEQTATFLSRENAFPSTSLLPTILTWNRKTLHPTKIHPPTDPSPRKTKLLPLLPLGLTFFPPLIV